jgi:hypothetical protein
MTSSRQLRATGWSRYLDTVFLSVWLAFWLIGEVVALGLLGALLASAASAALGHPLALASRVAPTDGSVSIFLLFILVWLSLWTLGGVAASAHLFRRLAGADRVDIMAGGVQLERRAGPFTRRRDVPLLLIHRIRQRSHDKAVVIDTAEGTRVVSDLGTPAERTALLAWLSASLTLPDADALRQRERATAPRDRDVRAEGAATIARHPARRHRAVLAWIGWGLVLVLSFGWVGVLWRAEPGVSSGEWGSAALTMLVAAAATWFTWTELEWVLSPGQLRLRRRWAGWTLRVQTFDTSSHLALECRRDSDGDDRYTLVVRDVNRRRVLATAMFDPYELLALGEWVGARSGLRFTRLEM